VLAVTTPDVLHVVRRGADCFPLRLCQRGGERHAVLLIGEGVYNRPALGVHTFFALACARARGVEPAGEALADTEIIALLARSRRVIAW
jgi:hypothetical protein